MNFDTFLGSRDLSRVLSDLQFTCLDIGARGGFVEDLLPLAASVNAIGFEPDQDECERLNLGAKQNSHPWRSLQYLPVALGENHRTRTLHIYHKRGCSSLFEANVPLVRSFGRDDNFQLEGKVEMPTEPLDRAAEHYGFADAVFMKTDVQGAELEIFRSAPKLLRKQVLAIRTEVEFLSIYHKQPLFSEVEMFLREAGFVPMGFVQLDHWRRTTRRKLPELSDGPLPYSRGQIAHGDMLFFRDPDLMADDTSKAVEALLKMAFIALTYEYVDHAMAILKRPAVARYLSTYNMDLEKELSTVSRHLLRKHRQSVWNERKSQLRSYLSRKIKNSKQD